MAQLTAPGWAIGDCIETMRQLPDGFAHTCVTSPPYWGLRDYGHDGQIGLEETPEQYVARMVDVFREVKRVLRDDGTLWLNLGDSYHGGGGGNYGDGKSTRTHQQHPTKVRHGALAGLKPKDLVGIPWRVAFGLQADGWYLRSDIIWHKPNPMPESVTDRPTKAHEYVFLLSKSARYYYDGDAVREASNDGVIGRAGTVAGLLGASAKGHETGLAPQSGARSGVGMVRTAHRNRRTVWTVATTPYSGAHFACYPPDLIKPCIMAGCPEGGIVLDPFFGSGTTGRVAEDLGRRWFGCELNPDYEPLIKERTSQRGLL